jgi:high affinity sulfate transporter 1
MSAVAAPATGRSALRRWVPGLDALATYQRAWLPRDLIAGLVLSTLLVPQGMAYAELAGLPAITGLYTTIWCLLAYAVFGPSRVLVLGPDSSLGPMIAAVIIPIAGSGGDPARAVGLASMLALLVGLMMAIAGIAKLGFIADLLSRPTQIGYMNGLALTILVSQLPKLFGFSVDGDGLIGEATGFVRGVASGETVAVALAIGGFGLLAIVALNRWLPKVPAILLAVIASIGVASAFDVADRGVDLVGALPQGFPPFTLPTMAWSDVTLLLGGALGITLVSLTDTISTSSSYAARTGQEVRGNQEMLGIGSANIAASLFQGFAVSTSGSRTAVAFQSGARTQLTGVVGAACIVLMLVFVPGLLRNLPQPTLAAVVIAASLSLADVRGAARLWRQRRIEFGLSITAFLGVALLGVLPGIGVAVALSVLNVFRRAWWPYQAELGRADGVAGYHDMRSYPDAKRLPGLVLIRFDAPLIFANARAFRDEIREIAQAEPVPKWIVVAAEPITDVDTTAADMLVDLDEYLNARGISLVFAELKDPVRRKLDRYKLTGPIDPAHFFPTLEDAVAAYRALTGVGWVDTSTPERPAGPDGAAPAAGPGGAARAAGPDGATHIDSADTDSRGGDHDRTRAVDPGTGAVHQ